MPLHIGEAYDVTRMEGNEVTSLYDYDCTLLWEASISDARFQLCFPSDNVAEGNLPVR